MEKVIFILIEWDAVVKVKVSHTLIAIWAVCVCVGGGGGGLEAHCILDTANERRSPSLSFRCLNPFQVSGAKTRAQSHEIPAIFCAITDRP